MSIIDLKSKNNKNVWSKNYETKNDTPSEFGAVEDVTCIQE